MIYRNKRTGILFDFKNQVAGDLWEAVKTETQAPAEKPEAVKEAKKPAGKAAKSGGRRKT